MDRITTEPERDAGCTPPPGDMHRDGFTMAEAEARRWCDRLAHRIGWPAHIMGAEVAARWRAANAARAEADRLTRQAHALLAEPGMREAAAAARKRADAAAEGMDLERLRLVTGYEARAHPAGGFAVAECWRCAGATWRGTAAPIEGAAFLSRSTLARMAAEAAP